MSVLDHEVRKWMNEDFQFFWRRSGPGFLWAVTRVKAWGGIVIETQVVSGVVEDEEMHSFVWAFGFATLQGRE